MFVHPQFDPVALQLGPLAFRWYGLTYLLGFSLIWLLGRYRIQQQPVGEIKFNDLDDVLFYGMLGTIVGGRLGYVLFYKLEDYISVPWKAFYVWEGGMSFHGGFLGVVIAMALLAIHKQKDWMRVTDFIAPLVPLGLAAGRMGNFINGELWGRPTDVAWAMVFPSVDALPRHPSQLYQFALEGVLLFAVLWWLTRRPLARGVASAAFLIGYGSLRFIVEYTREPDWFLGLLAFGWSMGQWLSLPMVLAGAAMLVYALKQDKITNKIR